MVSSVDSGRIARIDHGDAIGGVALTVDQPEVIVVKGGDAGDR